ncbi:hypothetical protein [Streptacidiphilus sp. MAP5-3]|uniref:hypothetical protein n=1 Tax=unclassified Streptacidiphilus TaxID=2643834 RepID=UPI003518D415
MDAGRDAWVEGRDAGFHGALHTKHWRSLAALRTSQSGHVQSSFGRATGGLGFEGAFGESLGRGSSHTRQARRLGAL